MKTNPFDNIGIGVTFSPNLNANLNAVARLCIKFNSKLTLIHVGEASDDKNEVFSNLLKPFLANGLQYKVVFKTGKPVDVILSVSKKNKVDLLVIGALKKENILKYYVGSIARKITRKAQCSVLLLINPTVAPSPCKHIVVNGLKSPKTHQAIESAFYVSHHLEAKKLTIVEEISQHQVHVNVEDDKSLRKSTIVKERIQLRENSRINKIIENIPTVYKSKSNFTTQSIFGKSGYSIGHYAQLVRADLLIMNAPNKTSFWDRVFPHDIEYILTELPTDVLIIR